MYILPGWLNEVFCKLWASCVCTYMGLFFVNDLDGSLGQVISGG